MYNVGRNGGVRVGSVRKFFVGCVGLLCLYLLLTGPVAAQRGKAVEAGRMEGVEVSAVAQIPPTRLSPPPTAAPTFSPPEDEDGPGAHLPEDESAVTPPPLPESDESVQETTITGGLAVKNQTGYEVDLEAVLAGGTALHLPSEGAQILIVHTHSSEAYTPAGLDRYEASDTHRTQDERYNVIRVGDELAAAWEAAGLHVRHDRGVYDFPSYTGSYSRSGAAVEQALAEEPGIAVIIDLHRDALGTGDVTYKIMAEETGVVASQLMLLVGSDAGGLSHPGWRNNLAFALYLQRAANAAYPTLMRPVDLVPQRYNQHLSPGMLILEVGSSGNTLQEALAAVRLFGEATAPALLALIEENAA